MDIKTTEFGFIEIIDNSIVKRIVCNYDGICTVYFNNKTTRKLQVGCTSYNRQYGIPISDDGTKLFVGSWERGLCAYDINSGKILWQFKPGKVRNIFIYSTYLIVLRANTSIVKIDLETGEMLAHIKSGTLERIFSLDSLHIFADTISGKHCIIDVNKMVVVKKYTSKIVNPFDCLSLMITNVILQNNALTICGIEEYPRDQFTTLNDSCKQAFLRVIDHAFIVEG